MHTQKHKSVLLYNLFPYYYWREVTDSLLSQVFHTDIIIHISIPKKKPLNAIKAYYYLKKRANVKKIYFSLNFKKKGESIGFEMFRKNVDFTKYTIATYMHSKGTSHKSKSAQPIKDWTELLRYFVVERLDLAQLAFKKGYYLYGVNLLKKHLEDADGKPLFPESNFHYSGNFVTINLDRLREVFLKTKCRPHYYGVEVFWGRLCKMEKAYCAHQSNVYHYTDVYPPQNYKP